MMDFLEHLPDAAAAERVLARARDIARDFLFIRHPSFEDEHYLNALGLKQYWTHWSGHTAKITLAEFAGMFQRLALRHISLIFRRPAHDSFDASVLPLNTPIDQLHYDEAQHGPKPLIQFPRPLYAQNDIFVWLREIDADEWVRITAPWD